MSDEPGRQRARPATDPRTIAPWHVDGKPRSRVPGRRDNEGNKAGNQELPYFAAPNLDLQTVDVSAAPDKVWELIGQFGAAYWHPLIAEIRLTGTGPGQLRTIETIDGKQIIERLDAMDDSGRFYRYSNIAGLPVANYTGMLSVKPNGAGSSVEWSAQFLPNGPGTLISKTIVSTLFKAGLDSLKTRF
jgi:Polyketide cyclase / dehydrase and lipid transport